MELMELAIGIILGIILGIAAGAIGFWVFNRKQKDELDSLRKAQTDLTAERDKAQKDKSDLENRLDAQIGDLESKVTEKTAQVNTLESEVAEKTAQVNTLTNNLREATAQVNTLESEVTEKTAQVNTLTNNLREATAQVNTLESEVTEKTAQISNLTNHLQQAGRQINDLTNNNEQLEDKLNQTAQSYNDAIQILYLSTLSLQACAIVLRDEMNHSQYLEEEFRKLANNYNKLLASYQSFSEAIKSKARSRLVRKGIGVALAFVPGLALIDILGDLGEILDVATEADEVVDGWDTVPSDDIVKSVEPSSVAPEVSDNGMPVEGISLLPFVPKVKIGIEEALPQSFSAESTAQDLLNLDTFVTDILKYMKDLVNLLKNTDKHQEAEAITKMINNLQKLGYKLHYPRPTTPNRRGGKSK